MKNYKIIILIIVILLNVASSILFPIASRIIYVDDNINGPWSGSKEYPYQRIREAINNVSFGMLFLFIMEHTMRIWL